MPYRPECKDQIIDFWQHVFAADSFDRRSYFEWKYERNPYLSAPILFVALDPEGRVVGTRGFHGSLWQASNARVLIPCAEDFAISPEHRSGGLATTLMQVAFEHLERDFEYTLSASAGQATLLHSRTMGWRSIGAMEPVGRVAWQGHARRGVLGASRLARRMWRPARVSRALSRKLHGDPFETLDRVGGRSARDGSAIAVERTPNPDALAELHARIASDRPIRHVRDSAFFAWRYANPAREYRFLVLERESRVDGYMALTRSHPLAVQISDWEGSTEQIRTELLEFALSHGRFPSMVAWAASLSDRSKQLLENEGFRPTQMEQRLRGLPSVLLKKLGPGGEWTIAGVPALDPSSWDVRLIDSMRG